jgi:sugar lactone lactonase YvrE
MEKRKPFEWIRVSLPPFLIFLAACGPATSQDLTGTSTGTASETITLTPQAETLTIEPVVPTEKLSATSEALPAVSQVCAENIAAPAPLGELEPAPIELAEGDYLAEWFVAPGAFNMPSAVLVAADGGLYVHSVRSNKLYDVDMEGVVTHLADAFAYQTDIDAEGNIYLHYFGRITRVSPEGAVDVLVEDQRLWVECEDGFGIGPDGNLYISCGHTSELAQITPQGNIVRVGENIPLLVDLQSTPDGRLLGAAEPSDIYEISLQDFSLSLFGSVRGDISPGGLAVDDDGYVYVSTGSRSVEGKIFRFEPEGGEPVLCAEVPFNGLSGIQWLPDTGEIVGGQLRVGGVVAVGPDESYREIVPGNGIITPMGLAFSPCGELAIANDDGGMMTLADPTGEISWLMDYISFIPPLSFIAFDPNGTMYVTESEPRIEPKRLSKLPPGSSGLITVTHADMPSGLVRRADGVLIVSETNTGRILQINPDGSKKVLAEGLRYPQALVLDSQGNLYIGVGNPLEFTPTVPNPVPHESDTILRLSSSGEIATIARLQGVMGLAISPQDDLFASVGEDVVRITPDGDPSVFASGFAHAVGLAFDLAGSLYVSDEVLNGIVRIGGFPQGTLSGAVVDGANAPVEGACVQVLSIDPVVVGQVVFTDSEGYFSLPAAPRTYSVIVTAEGYEQASVEEVIVAVERETEVVVILADG